MSAKDDNRIAMAFAETDDSARTATALRVDPTTSRLLITVAKVTTTTPAALTHKLDDNRVPTVYGVTDDASEDLTPLIADNRNDYLYVDLLEE